jgi:hypothetical protein
VPGQEFLSRVGPSRSELESSVGISREQNGHEPVTEITDPVEQCNRLVRRDTRISIPPVIRVFPSRLLRDATTASPGL